MQLDPGSKSQFLDKNLKIGLILNIREKVAMKNQDSSKIWSPEFEMFEREEIG